MQSGESNSEGPITQRTPSLATSDTRGKHRIQAALKRLEQEARFLEELYIKLPLVVAFSGLLLREDNYALSPDQSSVEGEDNYAHQTRVILWVLLVEELEQLEKTEKASAGCKEMLSNVETRPDPLLPITTGPLNPVWDRWFEGPKESQGCKCWIL